MNFDLTLDQKMLQDTASAFAKRESPVSRLRGLRESSSGWSSDVWSKMGELGWLAVPFPEEHGGLGGSFVELSLVLEAMGTTLVPEPILASVVLGGGAVSRAGDAGQRERWLSPMIAGQTSLALAYAERDSRFDVTWCRTRAEKAGGGYVLSGEKVFVLNGHAADAIVVSARTSGGFGDRDGVSLFVVDPKQKGVSIRSVKTMDGHRAGWLVLDGAEVAADARLGEAGSAASVLEELMDLGAAAACAEGVGILKTVLAMTRDYLCTREQFGVKIGTFQALQHRAVDMFVECELARSASMLATLSLAFAKAAERKAAVSAAKAQLAMSGRFVTQQAIQLHGGIGITDEHDVGLYFKRMHVLSTLFGDEDFHVARYGSLPSFS